jgi:Protein of unknown function (DUF3102)
VRNKLSLSPAQEINRLHAELNQTYDELLKVSKTTTEKAIRIGDLLIQQKAKLEHGDWLLWLETNVDFTPRTAQNYIRLHEERQEFKYETLSHLTAVYQPFTDNTEADPKPVGELSNPVMSEPVRPDLEPGEMPMPNIETEPEVSSEENVEADEPKPKRSRKVTLSLEDTLKHMGTQHVNKVCQELDDRAADQEERQHLIAVLLADFARLRKQAKDHFYPKPETAPGQTEAVS